MGVRKKGRRKITYDNNTYIWYVELDYDSPDYILHVISQDKQLIISCPLNQKVSYVINKGRQFQKNRTDGCWHRYRTPFAVPEIITPKVVSELIAWATKGEEALPLDIDLCGD